MSETVKITTTQDFLDGMLFGASRYYIGRHTICAHSAAMELAEFLRDNQNVMSKDRREFYAKDIREQINEVIHWSGNVHVEGQQEYHKPDALVILCRAISKYIKDRGLHIVNSYTKMDQDDEFYPADYEFVINLNTGEVAIEHREHPGTSSIVPADINELVSDLTVWSKLAGWLDPYIRISARYGDTAVNDELGFEFPSIGRYEGGEHMHLHINTVTAAYYIKTPFTDTYIAPEYITQVNKIR